MLIDAKGLGCPKPVMMAEEALSKMTEGIIEVLVDNEASAGNLVWFAQKSGFHTELVKEDNQWRVTIVKGHTCEASAEKGKTEEPEKSLLLIVGSDTMGKDEELGKILMKGFFETMKVHKQFPHTIFFLNAGVRLTTLNEEVVPILKQLETMGVEIFSCGTCLKHYNLESSLRAGFRGATNTIVEGMQDFKKTVWIG